MDDFDIPDDSYLREKPIPDNVKQWNEVRVELKLSQPPFLIQHFSTLYGGFYF